MQSLPKNQTLVVIHNKDHILHQPNGTYHPEKPDRLTKIIERLENLGIFQQCSLITEFPSSLEHVQATHSTSYIDFVKKLSENDEGDSYHNPDTHTAAVSGASGICLAVDKVLSKEYQHAFCLIRPPGHHANMVEDDITGFCIYNNVAIAAKYAQKQYKVKKILIFDWDVHHGDSTQKIFYEKNDILFISLHKYLQGHFYPGASGSMSNTGKGNGKGYNINCPWDITEEAGCTRIVGDNEYVYILETVLVPIINSFGPELIFVSAGFDSANGDPLGGLALSPFGYSYMLQRLLSFQKKLIVTLEGGYNPEVNAISAEYCIRTLLGEKVPVNKGSAKWSQEYMKDNCFPNKVALDLGERLILTHQKSWPVLQEENNKALREKIKQADEKYRKEDLLLTSKPATIVRKGQLIKDFKLDEYLLFKKALDENSTCYKSLKILEDFLPSQVLQIKRKDLNLTQYDFDLENFKDLSYFIYKVGCKDLENDAQVYLNKSSRIVKVVVRDQDNKIIEKFDENQNYGLNYDMKINDFDHDRFILFLRFFLQSQDRAFPNIKAFFYFRDFVIKVKDWLKWNNRISFSSFTFGFFLDNERKYQRACLLDFEDLTLSSSETENQNEAIYKVMNEMADTLIDDEQFVTND